MTQEQETKKKKKKKIVYDIEPSNTGNELYQTEDFISKLDEYYDTYGTFKLTASKLNEAFDSKIKSSTVAELYKKHISIKLGTERDASKFFENSFVRMQKRWEDSWEMIGDLVSEYKRFRKIIKERSGDSLTEALTFIKMSAQIIQITSEIRKQLEFISKQQEEIKTYQQNNLIITSNQINLSIKDMFTKMSEKEIQDFFANLKDKRFAKYTRDLGSKNDK